MLVPPFTHQLGEFKEVSWVENVLPELRWIAPACPDFLPDVDYLYLAAKYVQKTFTMFDDATEVKLDGKSAFELLIDEVSEIGDKMEQMHCSKDQ